MRQAQPSQHAKDSMSTQPKKCQTKTDWQRTGWVGKLLLIWQGTENGVKGSRVTHDILTRAQPAFTNETSMYNKTITEFGLSRITQYQDSASADSTYLTIDNSGYHKNTSSSKCL